jgi:Thiamine pyrophosphate-requiring enzymes [acetolactate synthase, pyruvate dehydrogenase (cytochrome), glyoxylate carboligase, phosphonopyruvate decarboxylase]
VISNGLASMALALPGGIAASLLYPQRQIVALMGDGGFLMNVQELETARRLGVRCTYVVVTDDEFGLIRWNQDRHHGHHFGTDLKNPDFAALAAAFGVRAYTPQNVAELDAQLGEAIAAPELNLVVVPVDAAVNLALMEKLDRYWKQTRKQTEEQT